MHAEVSVPAPPRETIRPGEVHDVLGRHILADGMEIVCDLQASQGSWLVDARSGRRYLDMFTFFASSALGMNHPGLRDDPVFREELLQAAMNKPSNSDVYSVAMAEFVSTFARVLGDPALPHLFFVEGGALAVENALKVCFDWKSRHNERHGRDPRLGTKVLHLEGAFHGRSGYTLSLTNTDPVKTARFPQFDWPRIPAPYLRERDTQAETIARERRALEAASAAFAAFPHDIACFVMEPVQGEGGDRHFRAEFLQQMQQLCHSHDVLFVLDEVQTGVGLTGTSWCYQQLGVSPDVVAFGKKTQVCGVMAGGRVDEVEENVFRVGSRINSTWGGNLTDMVRARRILEVIEAEGLIAQAAGAGEVLLDLLRGVGREYAQVSEVRGRGLMCALDLPTPATRSRVLAQLAEEGVLALPCGSVSIRFRPALTVSDEELEAACAGLRRAIERVSYGR